MMVVMFVKIWFARYAALAGMAGALLVGCSGGGSEPNLSSAPPSPSSSSSASDVVASSAAPVVPGVPADVPRTGHNVKPGETPPVYPAAALVKSQAGANAFAVFFMKTLDWAYATTNPSYMKHYYGPTCGLCSGLATGISKTAAADRWYEGGRLTITGASTDRGTGITAPHEFCTEMRVDITATTVVDETGHIFTGQGALPSQAFRLCSQFQRTTWQASYFVGAS